MNSNISLKRRLEEDDQSSTGIGSSGSSSEISSSPKRLKLDFDPNKYLLFNCSQPELKSDWANNKDNHEKQVECFLDVKEACDAYNSHFRNIGFGENLMKTQKFLSHYITVTNNHKTDFTHQQLSSHLVINDCNIVTDLLKKKYPDHSFSITYKEDSSLSYKPTGPMLLQTISQTLFCSLMVFSTKSFPVHIRPFLPLETWEANKANRKSLPVYIILHHTDSYLPQNSYWYPMKFSANDRDYSEEK
jgi:hypothetical protein